MSDKNINTIIKILSPSEDFFTLVLVVQNPFGKVLDCEVKNFDLTEFQDE